MKLILSDPDPRVIEAWKAQFLKRPEVEVRAEDLLETEAQAFLIPGNSFGILDSGIQLRVTETFGWEVEERLRARIQEAHDGELLVGQAVLLKLPSLPRAMVYAPIARTPRRLAGTVNVFLAVRGALLALQRHSTPPAIASLAVPGLGIAEGLEPLVSARQIRYAYEVLAGLRGPGGRNLSQLTRRERKMQVLPGSVEERSEPEQPAGGGEVARRSP